MYNYSPIKKLYVRNFRNIGDVEIDFTESPIVTLVGENEAGKTSIIKAFATCALHANPRDQKDCIRDNTKMFGVAIELEDGMRVTRIKEATGINSYQITDAEGKMVWSANKITDGLPVEVQKLMGLIAEPETNEFLHIRTYEDKLLFVVTPNSVNYKVMYNALKVEQLTKAIKMGSDEANSLKSKINTDSISIQTLSNQVKDIKVVDTESLVSVKNRLIAQTAILDKLERAKGLADKVNNCEIQLGALALIDRFKLEAINEVIASKLSTINRLLNKKNEAVNFSTIISEANNIEEINVNVVNRLGNVINIKNVLNSKIANAGALVHVSEISEIPEIRIMQLNKAMTLLNKLKSNNNLLNTIDTSSCNEVTQIQLNAITKLQRMNTLINSIKQKSIELEQSNNYIEQVHTYLKQCGVAVETCPKCGEAVVFDVDKLN